jgi:hypothetical protein
LNSMLIVSILSQSLRSFTVKSQGWFGGLLNLTVSNSQ